MSKLSRNVLQWAALMLLLALSLFPSATLGQDDIDKAFAASGLESLFANAPETALYVARQLGAEANVMSAWETSVQAHLAPDVMTEALRLEFADRLEPESIPAILAFRHSELGQAITAAEVAVNSTPDEVDEGNRRLAPQEIAALSTTRRELYARLAELTAARDGDGQFMGLVVALLSPLLPKAELDAAMTELAGIVQETSPMDISMERVSQTFRNFSDADLKTYITHLESPDGKAFLEAKSSGEDSVFRRAVQALGEDFAARINSQ